MPLPSTCMPSQLAFLADRGYSPVTVSSNAVIYYKLHGKPEATHRLLLIPGANAHVTSSSAPQCTALHPTVVPRRPANPYDFGHASTYLVGWLPLSRSAL